MEINTLRFSAPDKNIYIYHNLLKIDFDNFLNSLDELDNLDPLGSEITQWKQWGSGSPEDPDRYVFGEQKRFNEEKIINQSKAFYIHKSLLDPIIAASNHYATHHNLEIGQLAPISISRYFQNKFMGPHTDSYEGDSRPTISVVMYLNDDYEGGELYFREQDITIKAKSGDVVIFPSKPPYFHESKPIISGSKYICPGFWNKF